MELQFSKHEFGMITGKRGKSLCMIGETNECGVYNEVSLTILLS
jgi:hypothetical protein